MPVHTLVLRNKDDRVTELNGQRIVFPDAKHFEDIFPTHKIRTDLTPGRKLKFLVNLPTGKRGERLKVGDSLTINRDSGYQHFDVTIHPNIKKWITKGVLRIADQMHWRISVWPNEKESLVVLDHGQILGHHYIAIIDTDSIPKEAEDVSVTAS